MPDTNLPTYTNPPGSRTYQQPYTMTGCKAQFFVLKASKERLQALLDRQLNVIPGSPYTYKPLTEFVNACPMWIDKILCNDPPDSNMGWMRESDFNFSFFVAAHAPGEEKVAHVGVYFPYLLVDSPVTMASGREIWGYRKMLGQLEYVPGSYQPVAASTWVLKQYDKDQSLQLAEVARILPPRDEGTNPLLNLLGKIEQVVADVGMDVGIVIENIVGMFHQDNMRMIFLQELRDAQDPQRAAFQGLIESMMTMTTIRSSKLLQNGYSVKLTDYASYPLISDMGIEVKHDVAKSLATVEVDFDCVLQNGTVLATAGRTPTATA
jgi:hypothetical protein